MNRQASCSSRHPMLLVCVVTATLSLLTGCPGSTPDLGGVDLGPLDNGNGRPGDNQPGGALRPSEIDLNDGPPANLPDGTYTAGDVTVAFSGGAGHSAVVERETLFDWAAKAGLVTREQLNPPSPNAPSGGLNLGLAKARQSASAGAKLGARAQLSLMSGPLGGVQTLPLGENRFIAKIYLDEDPAKLWATLESLRFDAPNATMHAGIRLAVEPEEGTGDRSAAVELTWQGLSVAAGTLTVAAARLDWTSPDGVAGGEPLPSGTILCMGGGGELAAVEGVWVFDTVLSANEEALWDKDVALTQFGFEFTAEGQGAGIYGVNEAWEGPEGHPLSYFDYIEGFRRTQAVYPNAIVQIPVGGSGYVCGEPAKCQVTLHDLEVTEGVDGLAGRVEATYARMVESGGLLPGWERTDQMQRSVFQFGNGLVRLRSAPFVREDCRFEGSPLADLPSMPDAQTYELVFSRLDLHSQVLLDTGEELDGASDPEASISLVSGRVNDVPIRIDGEWNRPASYGEHFALTTHFEGDPPGATQYYWVGFTYLGQSPEESLPLPDGTAVTGSALEFTIPEAWRDKQGPRSQQSGGEQGRDPLDYYVFVFAYDDNEGLVGADGIRLQIE